MGVTSNGRAATSDTTTAMRPPSTAAHPLSSRAIGASADELIRACDVVEPRPADPPVAPDPTVAVAFSGGGFRATLTALGVLRFLADAGLLGHVRYSSSVSGGSVANGLFACRYERLAAAGFSGDAVDELVVGPFVRRITTRSLTMKLVKNLWKVAGPMTRTDLLADTFDEWFFDGRRLEDLSPDCRFIFNAANVTTGVRFGFERDVLGDWVMGRASTAGTGFRVAQAAAASAAVPGAFATLVVKGVDFPCANGRVAKLLDGGAYDNSGLEPVDDLGDTLLVAVNAGGLFRTGAYGGIPIIRDLQRSSTLLYRQSTGLRRREMVERFRAWEQAHKAGGPAPEWGRRGVLFGLATTFEGALSPPDEWLEGRPEHPEWRDQLANFKTSFARFPSQIANRLIYRGWWLTGATLSSFHREVLPAALPMWRELA
ncbi:MAG: patatin-like phospholipase family protein [Actinomycetota bacterium]